MQKPPDPAKLPGGVHNWLPVSDALKSHGIWNSSLSASAAASQKEPPKRSRFEDVVISSRPGNSIGGCKKCGLAGHLTSQCTNSKNFGILAEPIKKVKREIKKKK